MARRSDISFGHLAEPKIYPSDETTKKFFSHSSAKRINTDTVVAAALREQYPNLELIITPEYSCQLRAYAGAGHASFTAIESGDNLPSSLEWKQYIPPARRIDGSRGMLAERMIFGKFIYKWQGEEFIVYLVDGRDGAEPYPNVVNNYILTTDTAKVDALIFAVGQWSNELHDEVWVFDQGYWQKSKELYQSVMNASWDAVILDADMKEAIINDHLSFFKSRDTYGRLKVPWKRGIIYHGPPGNGKTISIKAMMHTLYSLKEPVPTLYVRSLTGFGGPELSIKQIFQKARQFAPCYLVLEDLDTIVTDNVRSYFLNEVDGLKSNDGIFTVGSTNHLDRLDPGISKRPARFDRKYLFPDPDIKQRTAYCHFWQSKLADNEEIKFPDKLCDAIAEITEKFSFAYIQEAFVAALLAIAQKSKGGSLDSFEFLTGAHDDGWVEVLASGDDDLEGNILWKEIRKQVKILREGMEGNRED